MFEELGSDFVITEAQYKQLKEWLAEYLVPTKRFNNFDTESSIKHAFEFSEDGFYVHDDIVVAAMLDAGFRVKDEKYPFHHFNISRKSPAFEILRKGRSHE